MIALLGFALWAGVGSVLNERCDLRIEHVVSLGDIDGPGIVGPTVHLRRDSRGQYYTTGGQFPGVIQVFDRDGRYSHSLGRFGSGPGEFRGISMLHITQGDTIVVVDNGNLRLTYLAPDGTYVRSIRFPVRTFPGGALYLGGERFLLNSSIATRDKAGLPLHLIDPHGNIVNSFGAAEAFFDARDLLGMRRAMTRGDSSVVWTATHSEYRIEAWDLSSANRVRSWEMRRDWWVRDEHHGLLSPDRLPPSHIAGLQFAPHVGLLIVVAIRAGNSWREGLERRREFEGEFWLPAQWGVVYNTMIELIDVGSGRLVGSVRAPHYVRGFVNDDFIFSYRERADGVPFLDVWRLKITGCTLR
jgi:hypothetical protein